jgi:hypothetical protein
MASTDPRTKNHRRNVNTPLGRRLEDLRTAIVSSGRRLLSWDELQREKAERRGERPLSDRD